MDLWDLELLGNEEGEQVGSLDLVDCGCDSFVPVGLLHW